MDKKRNIREEYIVDNINQELTDPNEAYLIPITIDKHSRVVTDQNNEKSVQIDPTIPDHVRNITQTQIDLWSSNVGTDKTYIHVQSIPLDVWIINHPLNKRPSVTIIDSTGRKVSSTVEYISNYQLIIKHSGAMSGEVYLN